jgi:uncharacterized membrane protein
MRGSFRPPSFLPQYRLPRLRAISPRSYHGNTMTPMTRKILYAVTFEAGGILLSAGLLHLMSGAAAQDTLALSIANATLALAWSYAFNSMFEAWESRQTIRGRSLMRRAAHACLFEGGLTLLLVPLCAWWLSIGWLAALIYESSLIIAFLAYAALFTWAFDHIFGLPDSAR